MEIRVEHLDGVKFSATTRGHRIICDQPASNGGADSGMTPPELLLASLGTCAAFYAAQYLKNHHLSQSGLAVTVDAQKAAAPARLDHFTVDVTVPGLPDADRPGLLRAVNACLIKNTLGLPPLIETVIHSEAPVAA